ncbi:MAG: hypothetical protein GX456_00865 [Verrucomicrobia bacterium]|nr:hypothetical protein [Verrucomicrobiota bacterium]
MPPIFLPLIFLPLMFLPKYLVPMIFLLLDVPALSRLAANHDSPKIRMVLICRILWPGNLTGHSHIYPCVQPGDISGA